MGSIRRWLASDEGQGFIRDTWLPSRDGQAGAGGGGGGGRTKDADFESPEAFWKEFIKDFFQSFEYGADPPKIDPKGVLRDKLREVYFPRVEEQFSHLKSEKLFYLLLLQTTVMGQIVDCIRKLKSKAGPDGESGGAGKPPTLAHLELARDMFGYLACGMVKLDCGSLVQLKEIDKPCPLCP